MQPEQQINLDNIVGRGAGIRIPIQKWKAARIERAIETIAAHECYRQSMAALREAILKVDGRKSAGQAVWRNIGSAIACQRVDAGRGPQL